MGKRSRERRRVGWRLIHVDDIPTYARTIIVLAVLLTASVNLPLAGLVPELPDTVELDPQRSKPVPTPGGPLAGDLSGPVAEAANQVSTPTAQQVTNRTVPPPPAPTLQAPPASLGLQVQHPQQKPEEPVSNGGGGRIDHPQPSPTTTTTTPPPPTSTTTPSTEPVGNEPNSSPSGKQPVAVD
ncbi:hypothetical protein [Amycolatopsis suaedae]|uniref:Uncharacterized protein n=1 Tax=Amycolatopsis suaedae TaxID=2510978 RepID=A0A4Q7JCU5_9PSEU|nr:hypothetical protein [Amycolatopsis suaedae]RZQ64393.1 hypothetical protein EWH70_10550 [Amycolatopsis suaedae]